MACESRLIRLLGLLTVLAALSLSPVEARSATELTRWTDATVLPWLSGQLESHPRLKGQPVRVVALRGAVPDPAPDGLTASLVHRIGDALTARPGVLLVADTGADWRSYDGSRRLDCRPPRERYLIGVEVSVEGGDSARVLIRVLDLNDNTWAAGFVRTWDGRLERDDRRLLNQRHPVEGLRGQRGLPFTGGQPDLVASRLAAALACDLLAHPAEDLRAAVVPATEGGPAADAAALVANYLARAGAVRLVSDTAQANVLISGEVHELGADLRQLWVSVRPGQPDGDLPSLATAVYVRGGSVAAAAPVDGPSVAAQHVVVARPVVLRALRVLRLSAPCRPGECVADGAAIDVDDYDAPDSRLALEVSTDSGGHVSLLALRPGRGLVRMDITGCQGPHSVSLPARARLQHPLFAHDVPGDVAVFAVATGTEEARVRVSRLLADVPSDCRGAGLAGRELDRWLRALRRAAGDLEGEMDWRGLRLGLGAGSERVASR